MDNDQIKFRALYPWAILPKALTLAQSEPREEAVLYRDNFRWLRRARIQDLCMPWRLGQQVGWTIHCPVDIHMTPIADIELDRDVDISALGDVADVQQVWRRSSTAIGLREKSWLSLYDFKTGETWQSMFIPNGQGTVEWHLGWTIQIPENYFALVIPHEQQQRLVVPYGVLPSNTLNKVSEKAGFTLAVSPVVPLHVKRGEPIARLIVLPPDSMRHRATIC